MNSTPPTTEDRVWAVLAHLSALSFGMGILLPVVGWSDQRRKSNYASFQCLQALGYQSVGFTVWALLYLVVILLGSILLLVTFNTAHSENQDTLQSPSMVIFFVLVFGLFALYFVLPIVAAIACALGRDFRYPILGDRLARYLGYETSQQADEPTWLNEDLEFRWVAATGHFSILIALWGMLVPLTAWILQGKQSSFLRFQAIQTLIYQGIATILSFVGAFLYLIGIVLLFASMSAIGMPDLNSSMGIVSMMVLGVILVFSAVLILSVPLLHILGQWAGYRVLKGDDYRYPLIGRFVEKRLSGISALEEKSS